LGKRRRSQAGIPPHRHLGARRQEMNERIEIRIDVEDGAITDVTVYNLPKLRRYRSKRSMEEYC